MANLIQVEDGSFNDVPLIAGYNKHEGLMLTAGFAKNDTTLKAINAQWEEFIPQLILGRDPDEVTDKDRRVAKMVLEEGFGGVKPTVDKLGTLTTLLGDAHFNMVGTREIRRIAEKSKSPVYEYSYEYQVSLKVCL